MSDVEKKYHVMVDYYTEQHIDQNLLEIIQKESSETVLVNAASYFLHPKKGGKKIGNKLLENLMSVVDKKYPGDTGRFLCMKNEFPCESKANTTKRIDIMIEFEKYCIAIEAKVNSKLDNPLNEYSNALIDRSDSRECQQFVLVKKDNSTQTKDYLTEKGFLKNWEIITWSQLLDGMEGYIAKTENSSIANPYNNLIESLIKIDKKPKRLEDIENNLGDDLDRKLDILLKKLKPLVPNYNLYTWDGDKELREVIEPRLVLENKKDLFKIDICVGIRGLQFVVFKKSGYSNKLFKAMCDKYPFYYWQDYLDNYELYNRFVICYRDDEKEDVKGPQFPQNPSNEKPNLGIESVKREDTVLIKYDENDGWLNLAENKVKEIKEYLEAKLK
tara:strand:- start:211 stop:1371 length:1161 start_codon:yes stop_codon:yes gene_type:complete